MRAGPRSAISVVAAVLSVASVVLSLVAAAPPSEAIAWCPPGYHPFAEAEEERSAPSEAAGIAPRDAPGARSRSGCIADKHPESFQEIAAARAQLLAALNAPLPFAPPGAQRTALEQRQALAAARGSVPGAGGTWRPYGRGPLVTNDRRFSSVNGLGLVDLNGRVDSLDYDPATGRLFAAIGTGGVWMSEDKGKSWRSIGESLPTQITGALAWSSAGAGTLIVVTGEPFQAGLAHVGFGVFRTTDLGRTWQQATGVPDEILGFMVSVDPTNPKVVYVATSKGLYRSEDAGATFENVRLPTGACAGKTDNGRCLLANIVTDVVVQAPDTFGHKGGKVLAVVGYRAGPRPYPQDENVIESEGNGLYVSGTGRPGTFTKLSADGFAPPERIGRTELGVAGGPAQNHDYVYAIVQDAVLFRGGFALVDAPEDLWTGVTNTFLNGIYVSPDFGATWRKMADTATISENPATGSGLAVTGQALLFAPGIQAWYNEWVKPDPTRQTADGVPTRVLFGLEEVWQNDDTTAPADGPTTFHVIGRYFAGRTCLFFDVGVPYCPTGRPPVAETTTHPDQHDGLFVPDGRGGVTLVVGNDGGVYTQHVAAAEEFDNTKWGEGANDGFNTLLPYHVRMAKDGTAWFGLQDNGSGKIEPNGKQFMTFGGDGFFVAVDPNNSNYAWSETTFANMRVTTDGGQTWKSSAPDITNTQFSNPFVMDPLDSKHLMTAGRQVVETVDGPNTCVSADNQLVNLTVTCTWTKVFDLGTNQHPGDADASAGGRDPANSISAINLRGDAAYVGFCGPCGLLNTKVTFKRGLATNVGGDKPPRKMTSDGWHIAAARGLPNRMITSTAIDEKDPRTLYVTLGGYEAREWRPPGSFGDKNKQIGRGHVFVSRDAGQTFADVSGDLPNTPALWVVRWDGQLVVGTNVGAFISSDLKGSRWALLGTGLPSVLVTSLQVAPQDPDLLVASTFGRGVYIYESPKAAKVLGTRRLRPAPLPATGVSGGTGAWLAVLAAAALAAGLRRGRAPRR